MTEATPAELAVRLNTAVVELMGLIESATDAQWSKAPAEGEWTAAENLAAISRSLSRTG